MVNFRCQKEMPTEGTQAAERGKEDESAFCADLLSRFARSVGIEMSHQIMYIYAQRSRFARSVGIEIKTTKAADESLKSRASQEAWGLK